MYNKILPGRVKWLSDEKNQRFKDHLCPRLQGTDISGVQLQVTLQLTVSQPVRLGVEPLLGLMTRFYLCCGSDCYGLCLVARPIWRGGESVICLRSVFVNCKILQLYICTINYSIETTLSAMYSMYNTFTASVSPSCLQHIMPYRSFSYATAAA
jgi:hypothetical protein